MIGSWHSLYFKICRNKDYYRFCFRFLYETLGKGNIGVDVLRISMCVYLVLWLLYYQLQHKLLSICVSLKINFSLYVQKGFYLVRLIFRKIRGEL